MDKGMVQGEYELGKGAGGGLHWVFFQITGMFYSGFKMIVGNFGFKYDVINKDEQA